MLRDIVLTIAVLFCLGLTLRNPFAGILAWTWFSVMQPHEEVYGVISHTMRLNFTIAALTTLVWFLSKQRKWPTIDGTSVTFLAFFAWMTFNCLFAPFQESSWELWNENWKILALGVLVGAMATTRLRFHALIWVITLSLLYYGVKGGILSIMSGGTKHVSGPVDTIIGDQNQLALALLMILPLVNYLRVHSANRWVRTALIVGGGLTFLSVISSYSRGAFLALGALAVVGWLRSRNKLVYPLVVALFAYPVFNFMPAEFYDRINTLNDVDKDSSFQGRVMAWKVSYYYARDHFPLGAGFSGTEKSQIFNAYFPGVGTHAAHSIFFEVLGDHGFIGLALFLIILFLALVNTQKIRKATRRRPDLAWARDLATMIQLSLLAYCVGGAALSMAYYDIPIIWYFLLPALYQLVRKANPQKVNITASGISNFGSGRPATSNVFNSSA